MDNMRKSTERIVSGALFDFCAWLSSRPEPITVDSKHDVPPLIVALKEWSSQRGIILDDPEHDWMTHTNRIMHARDEMRRAFRDDDDLLRTYIDNVAMLLYDNIPTSSLERKEFRDSMAEKVVDLFAAV